MSNANVEDIVESVIGEMIRDEVLFTALDVSNKVKEILPFTRHREVRDLVRASFSTQIEPSGYAKTPIQVTLDDGSVVEALLYHPLTDSWDLDAKYDDQKRSQKSMRPAANPVVSVPATVKDDGTIVVNPPLTSVSPVAATSAPPVPTNARALWDNMFKSQPSLFPRK